MSFLYTEPSSSPHDSITHKQLRTIVRIFVKNRILPFVHEWDESGHVSRNLFGEFARLGLLPLTVGMNVVM